MKLLKGLIAGIKIRLHKEADPVSRADADRLRFTREVKTQLLKLKEKGLALPIFTL